MIELLTMYQRWLTRWPRWTPRLGEYRNVAGEQEDSEEALLALTKGRERVRRQCSLAVIFKWLAKWRLTIYGWYMVIYGYCMVNIWLMMVNNWNIWGFRHRATPKTHAGWFFLWKIPSRNGWWLGLPLFQETPKFRQNGCENEWCQPWINKPWFMN